MQWLDKAEGCCKHLKNGHLYGMCEVAWKNFRVIALLENCFSRTKGWVLWLHFWNTLMGVYFKLTEVNSVNTALLLNSTVQLGGSKHLEVGLVFSTSWTLVLTGRSNKDKNEGYVGKCSMILIHTNWQNNEAQFWKNEPSYHYWLCTTQILTLLANWDVGNG